MSMEQTVIISSNPKSGSYSRQELVQELKLAIESLGFPCELHTDLQAMAARCQELVKTGELRTVVAAGGDGTASMVASLIPHGVPLTLFPTGSENLLARYLAITSDPASCARLIQKLRTSPIDAMTVNGKLSLLMASIGFDAEVVRKVHQSRRSHVSKLTYWSAIARTLIAYSWPKLTISIFDENDKLLEQITGGWVFVFNVPRYAAGLALMNDAVEHDGYLDVGVFDQGGLIRNMWYYWNVIRGKHHLLKQWRRFRSRGIKIEHAQPSTHPAGQPTAITSCQADGDWICELPVSIQMVPRELRIVG
jgi:diacylglycerol kinase (ATP)